MLGRPTYLISENILNIRYEKVVNNYTINQNFTGATLVLNHLGEPEKPFTILAGNALGRNYCDLKLIELLQD